MNPYESMKYSAMKLIGIELSSSWKNSFEAKKRIFKKIKNKHSLSIELFAALWFKRKKMKWKKNLNCERHVESNAVNNV